MENEQIFIKNQIELEKWLDKNYKRKNSVWLVYYKKSSGKAEIDIDQIIDSLICYGWIDSLPRKLDEEKTMLRISPRNPKSNWSKVTKLKVERLEKQGRLKPNGIKLIKIAKKTGTWDALNDVENLILPDDLETELKKQNLLESWHNLSRSIKRGFLEFLFNAKKQETRNKQINKIIKELEG